METKKIRWAAAVALLLVPVAVIGPGVLADRERTVRGAERCDEHRLASPTGEAPRRVLPTYVRRYGCATFREMDSIEDMMIWCQAHHLGDTVSSDVVFGCRPGETPGGCERFWVCE